MMQQTANFKKTKIILPSMIGSFFILQLLFCAHQSWAEDRTEEIPDPSGMTTTLRTISLAAEDYAFNHDKIYPSKLSDLTEGSGAYLTKEYCNERVWGYSYDCAFSSQGYKITAIPVGESRIGTQILSISTGGILQMIPFSQAQKLPDFFSSPRDFWDLSQIQKYEKYLNADPGNYRLRLVLANLYLGHGEGQKACSLAEAVIASHPDEITVQKAYHIDVLGYYVMGDLKQSYQKNQENLQSFPSDETALSLQQLLDSILKEKPTDPPANPPIFSNLSLGWDSNPSSNGLPVPAYSSQIGN